MIMSSMPEFTPWLVSNTKKNKLFNKNNSGEQENTADGVQFTKWMPAKLEDVDLEKLNDAADDIENTTETIEAAVEEIKEIVEVADAQEDPPELVEVEPKILFEYTQEEYVKFGEDEYQRGYNSYKESEGIEFLERIGRIEGLINTFSSESMDVSEFYHPLKDLLIKSIESIMHVDLKESKKSVLNIFSSILEEVQLDGNKSVRIFVHPSDAVFLRDIKQSEDIEVQIVSDPRLSRGSVRAVMGDAIIESIKEKRIDSIVKLMLGSYKESKK